MSYVIRKGVQIDNTENLDIDPYLFYVCVTQYVARVNNRSQWAYTLALLNGFELESSAEEAIAELNGGRS